MNKNARHILLTVSLLALTTIFAGVSQGSAETAPDALCGAGQTLSRGCDAIRAREIVDVTQAPWRGIGRINFASIQIRTHCTGTLVADQIVLTAAHCLYNDARKSWIPAQSIQFLAGYQRSDHTAASRVRRYVVGPGQDTNSRAFNKAPASDWALLVLDTPIGADAGVMEIGPTPHDTLILAGYPALRPHVASVARDCGAAQNTNAAVFLNSCAAMKGDSGAPLLMVSDGQARIVGVLSAVTTGPAGLQTIAIPADQWEPTLRALQQAPTGIE